MIYLLDANVLIDANRDYYPISRVPEFWDWLEFQGTQGTVALPLEVHDEIKEGSDDLAKWAREKDVKASLILEEEPNIDLVSRAVAEGYAPDLTDDELVKLGRDPFLVGYALVNVHGRTIVSTEVSKPSKKRANKHLPDVCAHFGVACLTTFQMATALDFRTDWGRN